MSVLCGNRRAHGKDKVKHANLDEARACFMNSGLIKETPAPAFRRQPRPEAMVRPNYHGPDGLTSCGNGCCDPFPRGARMDDDRNARPEPVTRRQVDLRQPGEIMVTGPLQKGYFTVTFDGGERRTLRLRRQDKDADFRPGQLLIGYLDGPNNEGDYQNVGEVREVDGKAVAVRIWYKHRNKTAVVEAIKVLCGDPLAAIKAYAEESGRCSHCNHLLTVPQGPRSQKLNPYRDRGLGPDCGEEILG